MILYNFKCFINYTVLLIIFILEKFLLFFH